MITRRTPLNIEARIEFLKHKHKDGINCKGVQQSGQWHLHSRDVTIYSLTILRFISTWIIIHRQVHLQDPSPTPFLPPHSLIHSPGGRGRQCLWPQGVHTNTQTRTRVHTGRQRARTRTHTHSLPHSTAFLFHGFEPLTLQGPRDTES